MIQANKRKQLLVLFLTASESLGILPSNW